MSYYYQVGSLIEQKTSDGKLRLVIVTEIIPRIHNGKHGFDGYVYGQRGKHVWGYDEQIVRVIKY